MKPLSHIKLYLTFLTLLILMDKRIADAQHRQKEQRAEAICQQIFKVNVFFECAGVPGQPGKKVGKVR